MTNLAETSIIVVDDEREDGLAVVRALSHAGLGSAYFTGAVEELPQAALTGVRLAVLDMDLGEGDVAGREPEARLAPLLSVLARLIDKTNGPYIAAIWTSNPNLETTFKQEFSRLNPTAPPMFISCINKAEYYRGTEFDSEKLQAKLAECVEKAWPLNLLIGWESSSKQASNDVVSLLSKTVLEVVGSGSVSAAGFDARLETWVQRLAAILRALTVAMSSERVRAEQAAFALYSGLNEIERDQLEKLASRADAETSRRGARLLDAGVRAHTRGDTAIMNGALLFSAPPATDPVPWPGDVFRYSDFFPSGGHPPVEFTGEQILKDVFDHGKLSLTPKGGETIALHHLPAVTTDCTIVMVEVTPVCDYVQDKHVFSSFVCGVLVPEHHQDKLKQSNAHYIWKTPPFSIRGAGSYELIDTVLIIDFQYAFATKKQGAGNARPLFRFRETVLHDIQAGRGRHVSRPGYVSVHSPSRELP